jgi:hypothetical protein
MTLTEFLLARIAEDEAEIANPEWATLPSDGWMGHAAAWGRPRALAECEAKRLIVEDFEVYAADYRAAPSDFAAGRRHAALLAASRVAAIYASHADYLSEWKP